MFLTTPPKMSILGAASAIALICVAGAATAQNQPPPIDMSKLPTTFAAASAALPSDPAWPRAYKPKSKRDFTGVWERADEGQRQAARGQGAGGGAPQGAARGPGGPPQGGQGGGGGRGRGQAGGGASPAPMTPAYAAIFKQRQTDRAAGKVTGDPTANCAPGGMPRMMTHSPFPMEIVMNDRQINIYREYEEQLRRIYIDGRKLPLDPDPTYRGVSVGHWNGNVLEATTIGLRDDTNVDAIGTPHSDQLILYERMWLVDDDHLNYEVTLVDPKAYTQPWTETRSWKRSDPKLEIQPYNCMENNRNPVGANGATSVILK
jgi:hypothetical protein